jgi:hypothetical protein
LFLGKYTVCFRELPKKVVISNLKGVSVIEIVVVSRSFFKVTCSK